MSSEATKPYDPDYRLDGTYQEANLIKASGFEALCPSYIELAEADLRYRNETFIGAGSVKEVHRTYDTRSKRWVALARLRKDRGPEYYDKFVHEAWLTSSLSHPNIINIYDVGVDTDGLPFFTMDLKRGTALEHSIGLLPQQRLEIFSKICDAVSYAHSQKVLHLDLKPANIQVDRFGEVLVCDWGLSKVLGDSESEEQLLQNNPSNPGHLSTDCITYVGQINGTLGFMAPEQVVINGNKTERTDVFALGCTLYKLLTGSSAFTGKTFEELVAQTREASILPPSIRFPERPFSPSLEAIVMKAVSKDPARRYNSVAALKNDLDRHLTGYAPHAQRNSLLRNISLFTKRNRSLVAIATAGIISLIALTLFLGLRIDRQLKTIGDGKSKVSEMQSRVSDMQSQMKTLKERETALEVRYEQQLQETLTAKQQLAAKLAKSANTLKNLGIFLRPQETVTAATQLANIAISLDPDCREAHFERCALECLQMDFAEAMKFVPHLQGHSHADYSKIAAAFRNFSYSQKRRPTVNTFASFIHEVKKINTQRAPLMERIVAYDFDTRHSVTDYSPVVEALIAYQNLAWKPQPFDYDKDSRSLTLGSKSPLQFKLPASGGSGQSFLRFLDLRSLRLELSNPLDITNLTGLSIEALDLRRASLRFTKSISLPHLKEVHVIRGSTNSERLLRRFIKSTSRFSVVEHESSS